MVVFFLSQVLLLFALFPGVCTLQRGFKAEKAPATAILEVFHASDVTCMSPIEQLGTFSLYRSSSIDDFASNASELCHLWPFGRPSRGISSLCITMEDVGISSSFHSALLVWSSQGEHERVQSISIFSSLSCTYVSLYLHY